MASIPDSVASSPVDLTLPHILPDLFQVLSDHPNRYGLVGGYCKKCDGHSFPAPSLCPGCYGDLQRRVFGEHGHVYSFTAVRTKAPFGLPEPYAVGYVDLVDVPLRVFALIDPAAIDNLMVGASVILKAMPLGIDGHGRACLRPVFQLGEHSRCKESA
jgi:uncharacterized OB-fold protein